MRATDETEPRKFLRLRRRWNGPDRASEPWSAPRPPVTDPRSIVRSNFEQDRQAGRYHVKKVRRRIGRRVFDFLVLLALGNGAGLGYLRWAEANPATVLITGSAMLFYTMAIGWVMFVHMDEY